MTTSVTTSGNTATIKVTTTDADKFTDSASAYKLKVNGTDVSATPTISTDQLILTFTYTAAADVTSFEIYK